MSDDAASWSPWQESGDTLPPTLNEQVKALTAERDALRATVDALRVLPISLALREAANDRKPGPVADDLRRLASAVDHVLVPRRALDGTAQDEPRPAPLHPICDGCDVRGSWEHRCHGEPCPCIDCREERRIFDPPAAQGEPLTGDLPTCTSCGARRCGPTYKCCEDCAQGWKTHAGDPRPETQR